MKLSLFIFLSLFVFQTTATAQPCSCRQNFDFLAEKIRLNYAGYRDKVTVDKLADFEQFTDKHRQMADTAATETSCFRVLSDWERWFKDGHVQLSMNFSNTKTDTAAVRALYQNTENLHVTEEDLIIQLIENSYKGPIEGVWQNAEGNYRIGIRAENGPKPHPQRDFAGFILKADSVYWMPGQVKFELKKCAMPDKYSARYYMRDHSMQTDTAVVKDGILQFEKLGAWYQVFPKKIEKPLKKGIFTLEMLDSSTALLVVPTMDERVRRQLDSLIKANKNLLARTPNLIIDCRNNGGGSDVTYRLISPLIYTNRSTRYRAQIWATKDNAQKYDDLHHDKNYPLAFRLYGAWMKGRILRHEGQFIGKKGLVKNAKLKKQACPERVAVLINSRCASSCESFVEEARQSKKVTLIGEHTAGVSDYGNLHTLQLPCSGFVMRYPTTRSSAVDLGKGIDNIGFQPDIYLQENNKDWVEFARKYLHEKK